MKKISVCLKLLLVIMFLFYAIGCVTKPAFIAFIPETKILSFSGYVWLVKNSEARVGPGPNYFSDSNENVWVDERGSLHLKITKRNNKWYCAQVTSEKNFGYGKYIFYLASKVDRLDENVVAGLFIFENVSGYNPREIDIEFSKWGGLHSENALFVAQGKNARHRHRFNIQLNENYSTHSFIWRSQSVFFQSIHGHYIGPPSNNHIIKSWTHMREDILPPGNENVRINLWLFKGKPPSDDKEIEIVIKKFEFIPQK